MSKLLQISLFLTAFNIIVLTGCKKDDSSAAVNAPGISFKSANLETTDTGSRVLKITIGYTDLDGDIGLSQSDTSGQFSENSPYYYNLMAYYYEFINGKYTQLTPKYPFNIGDTIRFNGRLPILTPAGYHKSITGDIVYSINLDAAPIKSNTIKFKIWIYDRALHKSNIIDTGDIVI